MYDAIVVGARCAGSPVAMLLAQRGHRVLLVDRATFPSDTISTHIVWPHGVEALARWGVADRLAASNTPPIGLDVTFDVGPFALHGTIPDANDGLGGFCPRRTVLDAILVEAAMEAGAEVRQGFVVDRLLFDDRAVVGIRGHDASGTPIEERAQLVIGADGVRSFVARAVDAPEYNGRPVAACAYYSYFSGMPDGDLEFYIRDRCAFGGGPTSNGLHLVMVNWPTSEFAAVREDIDGHVWRALDTAPGFAERVRAGRREEKWYGTAGVPGYFRKPYGPGWALVGDAGYNRDPVTAQGISDAFLDAEALVGALDAGWSGTESLDSLLASYESSRNERVGPMYEFTYQLARLEPPPPPMRQLFAALHGNRDATNAFLSALSGAISIRDFMAEENLARIVAASRGAVEAS